MTGIPEKMPGHGYPGTFFLELDQTQELFVLSAETIAGAILGWWKKDPKIP